MKIEYMFLNQEPGVRYSMTDSVLDPLEEVLFNLDKRLAHFDKLWKGDDYRLVFTIGATTKNDVIKFYGPLTLSKSRAVHFSIFIPYKTFPDYKSEIYYILDCLKEGIFFVFNKYKTDPSGVEEAIQKVKDLIATDPEKYRKWKREYGAK